MKFKVIISKKDPASMNIYKKLREKNFEDIYVTQERSINADNIHQKINADFVIFATKHKSTSLKKTLSVHNPGNWGKAEVGGKDFTLPKSNGNVLKNAYLELKKLNKLDYEVSGEVTHHGPFLHLPSLFIEIGSSKIQWKDEDAAEVIADVIINIVNKNHDENYKNAIGIGGTHYMPGFNKVLERTDIALPYICPKYQLDNLNLETLKQAIENSVNKIDFFLLEWKGLSSYKEKVTDLLSNFDIEVKKVKDI